MTNQHRHILIITNYFAPDAGAAAVRLTRLSHTLQQLGHRVTVLTSLPHYPEGRIHDGYQGKWAVVDDRDGVRIIQTWLWATPSAKISHKLISQASFMITALLRGLFLKRPDVILVEAQPIFTGLAGMLLAFWLRRRYVLNISDLWPDHLLSVGAVKETSAIYRTARRVVNVMYRRAAGIIAMSPAWASRIEGHIGTHRNLQVIFNGVDLARFQPHLDTTDFRQRYGIPADQKVIAFIGTLATQYDFELLLDALMKIQRPDTHVLLIGKGSQADFVRAQLQTPDLHHVHWIDWLPHDDMPLAWNTAYLTFWAMGDHDLYTGTIPAKLYEAMACGVPMVIYGQGIASDILAASGAGIIVDKDGADGLATAIIQLLDDPVQRQTLSENARRYAELNYDHVRVAKRYLAALEAGISPRQPGQHITFEN